MRVLCASIDLPGHLDWGGYLATAALLAGQGHEIHWASGPHVEREVVAAGVTFVRLQNSGWQHDLPPLPAHLAPADRETARRQRALDVWLAPQPVMAALGEMLALIENIKPDLILSEPYAAAAILLAEKLSLPLVVVGRPALPPADSDHPSAPAIRRLLEKAGVSGAYWDLARGMPRSPHLHLDFFCRRWYADLPEIASHTVFCGSAPLSSPAPPAPGERPVVLATLGSTFADDELFFRLAAECVNLVGGRSLLAVGRRVPHLLGSLRQAPPARAEVAAWIDFAAVFPGLAAIVHHGGAGTTHSALSHGLPQVVVPHAGDQYPQAARVTQAGVGYGIRPRDFTFANAPAILADILYVNDFREKAAVLAAEMQRLGGAKTAAQAVERLMG